MSFVSTATPYMDIQECLREGISVTQDRINLDVVRTDDFGFYECTASNNVNGENRSVTFPIELVASGKWQDTNTYLSLLVWK